ncbi:MAG TPA: hypothetical protein DDZ51_12160 [Planctomycetaceae bacterium]|nr:hypothetical protein [Planctomycetaceae bacterium]
MLMVVSETSPEAMPAKSAQRCPMWPKCLQVASARKASFISIQANRLPALVSALQVVATIGHFAINATHNEQRLLIGTGYISVGRNVVSSSV